MSITCSVQTKGQNVYSVVADSATVAQNVNAGNNGHICGDLNVEGEITVNNVNINDVLTVLGQASINVGYANASISATNAFIPSMTPGWTDIGIANPTYLSNFPIPAPTPNLVTINPDHLVVGRTGTWVVKVNTSITSSNFGASDCLLIGMGINGAVPNGTFFGTSCPAFSVIEDGNSGSLVIDLNVGDQLRFFVQQTLGVATTSTVPNGSIVIFQLLR